MSDTFCCLTCQTFWPPEEESEVAGLCMKCWDAKQATRVNALTLQLQETIAAIIQRGGSTSFSASFERHGRPPTSRRG